MNCKSTREMLSAYLDRELAAQERDAVRAHLADCDVCRTEERDLRALKGLLLGVRAPEPAADFEGRLMARLHAEAAVPARRRIALPAFRPLVLGQFGGLAGAAALAAVVIAHPSPSPKIAETTHSPVRTPALVQPVDYEGSVNRFMAYDGAEGFGGGGRLATNDAP